MERKISPLRLEGLRKMTKDYIYTVEELAKTFADHHVISEKNRERDIQSFKKKYPGEEIPQHLKDDFCIASALHCICQEIINLKEKTGAI